MEQQIQGRDRQRPEEQPQRAPELRTPERERLGGPSLLARAALARAALEGASLLEMPPGRLEELAAWLGNQGMADLLERQALPLEEARFPLPQAVETQPFPVPEDAPVPTAQPPSLTAGEPGGRAFDPAQLAE